MDFARLSSSQIGWNVYIWDFGIVTCRMGIEGFAICQVPWRWISKAGSKVTQVFLNVCHHYFPLSLLSLSSPPLRVLGEAVGHQ
jgi:hypothetical protein